jgi:PBSX family phage terminase large subunit
MNVKLNLLKHQKTFLLHKQKIGGLVAGFGSGKSYIATIKTILFNIQNPGINSAYYLPTYALVKDICFQVFPEILENHFDMIIDRDYQLNKSSKEIIFFEYNNRILFRNMMEPETIVGYESGYSLIDECDILNEQKMDVVWTKILGRNRKKTKTGLHNQIDVVGTPEGYKWFYKKFVEQKNDETMILIKAKTTDNKHLPKDFIEGLIDQYDPKLLEQYMNGEFVNINGNNCYYEFNRDKMDCDEDIVYGEELHIGQDFNVGGCCSAVYVERGSRLYLLEEIVSDNTFEIIDNLKRKFPNNKITMYPDASGKAMSSNATLSDVSLLHKAGFKIIAPTRNPRIIDRVNAVNSILKTGNFYINTKKCPNITKALEQQVFVNGKPEKFAGAATLDDYADAMGYYIANKHHITKPGFKSFQMS